MYPTLTLLRSFAIVRQHFRGSVYVKHRASHTSKSSAPHKLMKKKALKTRVPVAAPDPEGPAKLAQLKAYEEGLKYFQQQKFPRAKQALEKALEGPSKELQDRAQMHIRI